MTGNHVYGQLYRGFESLPLRDLLTTNTEPGEEGARFLVLSGWGGVQTDLGGRQLSDNVNVGAGTEAIR